LVELNDPKIFEEIENLERPENIIELDIDKALQNKIDFKEYDYNEALLLLRGSEEKVEQKEQEIVQKAPQKEENEQILKATNEIKEIVGSVGKEFEKSIKRETQRIKGEKLILPTLSLQDQISELEKISEGIDENVFNEEQRKIIKIEVRGLKDKIKNEKIMPSDELQRSLVALRNQKVEEVIKKITW